MNRKLKVIVLSLLFVLAFPVSVKASVVAPVQSDPTGYVEDYAGVISSETKRYIKEVNDNLVNNYSGCIVVVTVDYYKASSIEDYALAIFNQWKIGDSKTNDGTLLLLSIGDDDYYFCIGTGLENKFQISEVSDILWDYTEPDFADKDYDAAVRKTVGAVEDKLIDIYNQSHHVNPDPTPRPQQRESSALSLLMVIILLVVIIIMIRNNRKRRVYYSTHTPPHYSSHYTYHPSGHYNGYHPSSSYNSYHSGSSYHSSGSSSYSSGSSWSSGSSHSSSSSYSSHSSSSSSRPSGGSSRGAGAGRNR